MNRDLFDNPQLYDFYQAVRLLERNGHGVGRDVPPEHEAVRFRTQAASSFAAGEVVSLQTRSGRPPEMIVSFMGLIGNNGALPTHYTKLVLERLRRRDHALRDFLDLFNHRLVSYLYRAWEKSHFPFAYERCANEGQSDQFTEALYCLVGRGVDGLRERGKVADEAFLYYAGQFDQGVRSALSLQLILADYTELPVQVEEFVGQWLYLGEENQSYLGGNEIQPPRNAQLGSDVILGERVWDVQSKFRILIGPLSYEQFHRYTPSQPGMDEVVELTRSYVGLEYDFEVQLILQADEVPRCVLGERGERSPRLGWNSWIQSNLGDIDVNDATFAARS